MLHSVTLDGVRSFDEHVAIRFAPLTLLAGANNSGKSTVIQALLAFLQSEQTQSQSMLALTGAWCDLGAFDKVVSFRRLRDSFRFNIGLSGLNVGGQTVDCVWSFGSDEPASPEASVLELDYSVNRSPAPTTADEPAIPPSGVISSSEPGVYRLDGDGTVRTPLFVHPGAVHTAQSAARLDLLPMSVATTHHVGPFRLPPQPLYTPRSSQLGPRLGRYGEHTAEMIYRHRAHTVDLPVPGADPREMPLPLLPAINAWWSYVFGEQYTLNVGVPERLGFTLSLDSPSAERLGLGQVGLGLSQALPIVAACLISKPGDLLLIETPEAHLHPGAQHRLARLFVELSRRGRQVVVETHSEHMVNAARLAVKAKDLGPTDVAIQFFSQDDGRTSVREVDLDPNGRALSWPSGFFDQAAIDLAELLR